MGRFGDYVVAALLFVAGLELLGVWLCLDGAALPNRARGV
jgi:hypothetical protein